MARSDDDTDCLDGLGLIHRPSLFANTPIDWRLIMGFEVLIAQGELVIAEETATSGERRRVHRL